MPLQISAQSFKWLQGLNLIKEAKRNQNNMMEVNQQVSNKLTDGYSFGILIKSMLKSKSDEERIKKIDALKQNSTPAIRLYNWGLLSEVLKQMGYNLEYSDKSKITNQDPEPLAKIITYLSDLRAKDPNLRVQQQKSLKLDINEISKKGVKDVTNTLQFLTVIISKHFKISPQQALNLYLDNNKYLSHLLAKGVKNSFQPVHNLLAEIKSNAQFIVLRLFCIDEQQNVNFIFNALRTCLISKDEITANIYCQILIDIYDQYRLSALNLQICRNWIKSEGINTLFFSIKKHPLLSNNILQICYSYLDDEFFKYVQLSQKSILWGTQREKYSFYKIFVQETSLQVLQKFFITNYFEEWNKFLLKTMKKTKEIYEITIIISIMEIQWNKLGSKFQQHDLGIATQFINFLKTVLLQNNQLIFIQSCRTLFNFMQMLGSTKNPFAPLIYKILISVYTNLKDISQIEFMSNNFSVSFQGILSLPGSPLVQPLLNHLENNVQYSVISLGCMLIQEKRVSSEESLDLMEMFSKIVFQNIIFGVVTLDFMFENIKHIAYDMITGFLDNHIKLCLSQLYSHSKNITKTIKSLKQDLSKMPNLDNKSKETENFIINSSKYILCKNMVSYISKSLFIDQQLKKHSQNSIFSTYVKIIIELRKPQQAQLLRPVMTTYYEDEELQLKIKYYTDQLFPPKPKIQPKNHGHEHEHLTKSVSMKRSQKSITQQQDEKETAVFLDPSVLKPSSFAIKDLQNLKQKRYEMKTLEIQKEKQKVKKQQRVEKFKTIQHQKRLVQSMTTIKNDIQYKNLLTTIQPKSQNQTIDINKEGTVKDSNSINIRLINIENQEQDTYREEAESLMKKYRKVWRYLFYKYSIKKMDGGGQEKIHMGEAWKLLKDYDFNFLKKDECFTIIRLINENLKRKNDIQFLTYSGFQDFILQVAIIGFSKQGFAHLQPGQQILMLIEQLKKVTKQKSGSIEIFQNPQEAYFQQTEVIRQFNKRLKQNPDYILPQGYKRIKQTSLEYQYDFHPMLQKNINHSIIDVMQVLDFIIFKHPKLNFHIIQPLTIKSQSFFAKPALFQNLSFKMKEYSKGYLNPKRSISYINEEKSILNLPSPPQIAKKQIKPYVNFSLGIKLGIAQTSFKNKSIAEEVAYCMDDILNAIENQSPIKKGNKKRVVNDFIKRKRGELAKISTEKKKQEINWKKRAQSVKLEVEILRQKRKETEKAKKLKEYQEKKMKKEREDKVYRERIQQFEKVKAKIAQKKEILMQLKSVEDEKIKKQKEQYKQGVEEYFRKKKQQIKEKQEDYKKKKQQDKYIKQEIQQKSKEFVKKLYLNNLKKQQEVLEKVDEIKQTYDNAWQSDDIQKVITENRKSLKHLFDLLLKYEKSKISATNYDEIGLSTLNIFCIKFKIVPFMLQKQDVNKILMYACKDIEDRKASRKGINFQKFEEVIFLISVKAKNTLNKLVQKQKKKEKKMQAFLNAQKSAGGNHYETAEVSESESEQSSEQQQKPTLQDEYLFNAQSVTEQTLSQVFAFLKLPSDKLSMQERYKEAMQTKTSKPKKQLIKEIKESLQE